MSNQSQKGKYKVLIVGAGKQAILSDLPGSVNQNKVISFYKALKENGNFLIHGFLDTDMSKSITAMNVIRKDNMQYKPFSNDDIQYDVIIIATPDESHYTNLKDIIDRDLRPKLVICEKPLCTKTVEIEEIAKLYKQANIPILVNYTRRFIPYYKKIKADYIDGIYGDIKGIVIQYNRGIQHTLSHAIDTCNYLFGNDQWLGKQHIIDCSELHYRVWEMAFYFDDYHFTESRIGNEPVYNIFDNSMRHLIDNAYNYLEGNEGLLCTLDDAYNTFLQTELYQPILK